MPGCEFWPRHLLTLCPWSTSLCVGSLILQMDSASLCVKWFLRIDQCKHLARAWILVGTQRTHASETRTWVIFKIIFPYISQYN